MASATSGIESTPTGLADASLKDLRLRDDESLRASLLLLLRRIDHIDTRIGGKQKRQGY